MPTAPTFGLTKRGRLLPRIGPADLRDDPETDEDVIDIDDANLADAQALVCGGTSTTSAS